MPNGRPLGLESIDATLKKVSEGMDATNATTDTPKTIESVLKKNQEVANELSERANAIAVGIKGLQAEIDDPNKKLPEHKIFGEIWERAKREERVNTTTALVELAFEKAGPSNLVRKSGQSPEFYLDNLTTVNSVNEIDWNTPRGVGNPEISIKQIAKEQNVFDKMFSKATEASDEVLVVINMKNGSDELSNTVVTFMAKHTGGKLEIGPGQHWLFRVQSERTYKQLVEGNKTSGDTDIDIRAAKGEVTRSRYAKGFKNERHADMGKYWSDYDANLDKPPVIDPTNTQGHVETARWEEQKKYTEEAKKIAAEALTTKYSEWLQELQAANQELINYAEARIGEINAKNADIINNPVFQAVMKHGESPHVVNILAETFNVPATVITQLLISQKQQ